MSASTSQPARDGGAAKFARGDLVGRFFVLHELGCGSSGVVYETYDTELDRRVALKFLHESVEEDGRTERRFLAEARALARLSHPNVGAVYEVGTHKGRVYLVLELIEGRTLEQWLEQPPGWRAIVDAFIAAGLGLAAAHDLGLVHRDFKATNVVRGIDGRVRVVDFGLARSAPGADESGERLDLRLLAAGEDERSQTRPGLPAGTPSYLAPELYEGAPANPATDQYAFCVALWRALYGKPPFAGTGELEVLRAKTANEIQTGVGAPTWLRDVVRRGLDADPSQRFASMHELLFALGATQRRRRRRIGLALAGVFVALTAAWGWWALAPTCEQWRDRTHSVWNPQRQAGLRQALAPESDIHRTQQWAHLERRIDDYAAWLDREYFDHCEATQIRKERDPELFDGIVTCLNRRLHRFDAMLRIWSHSGPEALAGAVSALELLVPPQLCSDPEQTKPTQSLPPERQAAADQLYMELEAILVGGDSLAIDGDKIAALNELLERARAFGYPPLIADVSWHHYQSLAALNRWNEAGRAAQETYWMAVATEQDAFAIRAALHIVWQAVLDDRTDEARVWLRHAKAIIDRSGASQHYVASYHAGLASLAYAEGNLERTVEEARRSLALFDGTSVPYDSHRLQANTMLASALDDLGYHAESEEHFERSLEQTEAHCGPECLQTAIALANLAFVKQRRNKPEEARALLERSIELRSRLLGDDNRRLVQPLLYLTESYVHGNRLAQAAQYLERAQAIADSELDPDHLLHIGLQHVRALIAIRSGDYDRADELLQHIVKWCASQPQGNHFSAGVWLSVAELELARERPQPALEAALRSVSGFGRQALRADALLAKVRQAEALLALGRPSEALEIGTGALRELEQLEPEAARIVVAEAHWVVARAHATLRNAEQAQAAAERAARGFAEAGEIGQRGAADVEAWRNARKIRQ
jgi:serine/threonine protein kinase